MDARHEDTRPPRRTGEPVATKLCRIARKAHDEPDLRFVNLFHLLKVELLRECLGKLRETRPPALMR